VARTDADRGSLTELHDLAPLIAAVRGHLDAPACCSTGQPAGERWWTGASVHPGLPASRDWHGSPPT
jgi:hypothetical protein